MGAAQACFDARERPGPAQRPQGVYRVTWECAPLSRALPSAVSAFSANGYPLQADSLHRVRGAPQDEVAGRIRRVELRKLETGRRKDGERGRWSSGIGI